jgi:hypothetical protein
MTCEQCGDEFHGLKCSCGWKVPHLKIATDDHPADNWLTRQCPSCQNVTIREHLTRTTATVCKWCLAKEKTHVNSPGTEVVHGGARADFSGPDIDL